MIRKEISVLLNSGSVEKELVTLKFTLKEALGALKWKHHREFEFKGKMYDLVEKGITGDTLWLRCYQDQKETLLKKEKVKLIAKALGSDPAQKDQNRQIKNFFNTLFCQDAYTWNVYKFQPASFHYSLFTFHYSPFSFSPLSPPPKFA